MADAIEGIVGPRSMMEANESMWERGLLTGIPAPDYGYVASTPILHERERMAFGLYNDWLGGNLGELTYADRQGGEATQGYPYADCNGVRVDTA